jgi:D-alanyl-D-alanine carboxypeptidase
MSYSQPVVSTARRARARSSILPVLVVVAALMALLACCSLVGSSSGASTSVAEPSVHRPHDSLHNAPHNALDIADGLVPNGTTVFADDIPAVARLDPTLLRALRQAATRAADGGVELYVNSGWRSPEYQQRLLDEAVSQYGSRERAALWVATPTTSAHVSGDAVDIGHSEAAEWLSEHGAQYGLCQIYSNEPWHYELHPEAVYHGCPPQYANPTQDPRMQQ